MARRRGFVHAEQRKRVMALISHSGHGLSTPKVLSASAVRGVRAGKDVFVRVSGVRKKVTEGNLKGNRVFYYRRSDHSKGRNSVALRNFLRDKSIHAGFKPSGMRKAFEGDFIRRRGT